MGNGAAVQVIFVMYIVRPVCYSAYSEGRPFCKKERGTLEKDCGSVEGLHSLREALEAFQRHTLAPVRLGPG